ncbi:MAG: DUF190 domain-containing protein [Desulfuromonas sp.]|nr:DUF190 domain-containing protein [Desulfuromonas sp.]
MKIATEGQLLRIFIGEDSRYEGKPLYEWLVLEAKAQGMSGATVLQGMMGFGARSRIHTAKILRLSLDLPVIIEIVDSPDKIAAFLEHIEGVIDGGLVTLERAEVKIYRADKR